MNTSDRPDAHRPVADSPRSGPLPGSDPLFSDPPGHTKPPMPPSASVLRRVAGRWWQLLLLWMALTTPMVILVYLFVKPTYVASAILRVEAERPDPFGLIRNDLSQTRNVPYLKTQMALMTSDRVLSPALADPAVFNLQSITKSEDPKKDLREHLDVQNIENTNVIRVSLELPDAAEAVAIVQAVVQSYIVQNLAYSRSANSDLTENLKQQLAKIGNDIDSKKSQLKELYKRGKIRSVPPSEILNPKTETDPTQPTFRLVSPEQLGRMIDEQVRCDIDYLEASAHLEATRALRERHLSKLNDELDARAADEFEKDPKVAELIAQIGEFKRQDEPARQNHEKFLKALEAARAEILPRIRKRLTAEDHGTFSESKIRDLEVAMEQARMKKEAFAQQFTKLEVGNAEKNDDSFETTYLTHQIDSLVSLEDQVKKNLEQLKFESNQEDYRVVLIDPASAPKTPSHNRGLKYIAGLPFVFFFLLFGLFLAQEIGAGSDVRRPPAHLMD